jgi:hypothetical protein
VPDRRRLILLGIATKTKHRDADRLTDQATLWVDQDGRTQRRVVRVGRSMGGAGRVCARHLLMRSCSADGVGLDGLADEVHYG